MKKTISFIVLLFCCIFKLNAAEENSIYAENVTAKVGETVILPIYMNNSIGVCSAQFDLVLPEGTEIAYTFNSRGVKVYTFETTKDRFEDLDHTVSVSLQHDGAYRFVINSNTNSLIWDTDITNIDIRETSPLINVSIVVSEKAGVGDKSVQIKNVTLASYDVTMKKVTKYSGVASSSLLTVMNNIEYCAKPTISLVDGNIQFTCATPGADFHYTLSTSGISGDTQISQGTVSLTSGLTVSVYATAEGFEQSETATETFPLSLGQIGDMNGDGKITVSDVTKLADKVLEKVK